eukprot:SM012650S26266  [mRNA]  locus=s12650:74:172:+ [translate_table: standard]
MSLKRFPWMWALSLQPLAASRTPRSSLASQAS